MNPNLLSGLRAGTPAFKTQASTSDEAAPAASVWLEDFGDPRLVALRRQANAFVLDFLHWQRGRWLSLLGGSGTGKTFAARQAWTACKNAAIRRYSDDYDPRWLYWPKLAERLRSGDADERNDAGKLLMEAARWPLLVVDEVGQTRDASGYVTDRLTFLLCSRAGRWTLLTANLDLTELAEMDARIASRCVRAGSQVVRLEGVPDFAMRPNP